MFMRRRSTGGRPCPVPAPRPSQAASGRNTARRASSESGWDLGSARAESRRSRASRRRETLRRTRARSGARASPLGVPALVAFVAGLSGCAGELTAVAALTFSMTLAAWILGRDRQRRALYEAETLRHAIAAGRHRGLEDHLRRELALAAAGEAVSPERQWLARAQLGGLLVAEWRLDEAAEVYGTDREEELTPHLRALAAFGRHELSLLTRTPDEDRLAAIRQDRDDCMQHVPLVFRKDVERAWNAVEGLCLVRMGRPREGAPLIEAGLRALEYNPALVVYLFHLAQAYEQLGERQLAGKHYQSASLAFPGTRLASEAKARLRALGPGQSEAMFRDMLPEAPAAPTSTALVAAHAHEKGEDERTDL
jgi:tetratricopeptide (TPR) repeat protein